MRRLLFLLLGLSTAATHAQETVWMKNQHWLEDQISTCRNGVVGVCQSFPGSALNLLFGINEFCPGEKCVQASEVALAITKDAKWTYLGKASEQPILTRARQMAQGGMPVVAIQTNNTGGMIAIIMPGKPLRSTKWSLDVPLSVTTRPDRPENSLIGQGINFVFADPAKVKLYTQK
jgi:hypothetical protein